MTDNTLPLHLKNFNDKVRAMNQTGSKILHLTSNEARSLQAEFYTLLAENARLNMQINTNTQNQVTLEVDGGKF